ncbi:MAG: DUF3794 domain-containing protein [Clostridia bacterium]
MGTIVRDMVELFGIADSFPVYPIAFTELSLEECLETAESKPDINQILKVISDIRILNKRLIRTPVGKASSGLASTGYKLVVEAVLREKIIYAADEPTQAVYSAEFEKMFNTNITLPPIFYPVTSVLTKLIAVEPYIEDISIKLIDKRTMLKNTIIFINVASPLFMEKAAARYFR